jgi:hypothetical protein
MDLPDIAESGSDSEDLMGGPHHEYRAEAFEVDRIGVIRGGLAEVYWRPSWEPLPNLVNAQLALADALARQQQQQVRTRQKIYQLFGKLVSGCGGERRPRRGARHS